MMRLWTVHAGHFIVSRKLGLFGSAFLLMARDMTGRYIGILVPISTFVATGYEHSVANLVLLPAAMLAGAPLTMRDMIMKNLIPVTIGNGIAGAALIAASFSFSFGRLGEGK